MKEYMKPEIELIAFEMEAVTNGDVRPSSEDDGNW